MEPSPERLGALMAALAVPTRVRLLRLLHQPRTSSELRLAREATARWEPGSMLSRQTLEHHLGHLVAAGLVAARPGRRGNRVVTEYALRPEELRWLAGQLKELAERAEAARGPGPIHAPHAAPDARPALAHGNPPARAPALASASYAAGSTHPPALGRGLPGHAGAADTLEVA